MRLALILVCIFFTSCNLLNSGDDNFKAGSILFISNKGGSYQLYSMESDGSNVKKLTNDPSSPIVDAEWSPDNNKIAVISLTNNDLPSPSLGGSIFLMNSDGSNRHKITDSVISVRVSDSNETIKYAGARELVWSPDGKKLAFSRFTLPESSGRSDIFIVDTQSKIEVRITNFLEGSSNYLISDWPKEDTLYGSKTYLNEYDSLGRMIPYTSIGTFDQNGEYAEKFGEPGSTYGFPILKNDNSSTFVFNSNINSGRQEIYLNQPSTDSRLTNSENLLKRSVGWSPANNQILYNAGDNGLEGGIYGEIIILDMSSGDVKAITPFSPPVYSYSTSWKN